MSDSETPDASNAPKKTKIKFPKDPAKAARLTIFNVLIAVALGVGFGKIVGVDSVPDRTIQNVRLAQIPNALKDKEKELREKGAAPERIDSELKRVYAALLRDATKARPTLSANDRSRWATIRALVEPDARVYRYVPLKSDNPPGGDKNASDATPGEGSAESTADRAKYKPEEILRNCASDCPERFEKSKIAGKQYKKELVPFALDKVWESPGWDSIDVVKHARADEVYDPSNPASGYIYSSKPPLLPVVMAAPYWILNRCCGLSLAERPFETARLLLILYNLIPLGVAFACLASLIESLGRTDWGRIYAVAVATFGSFALTFSATLNNCLPGFVCISIALWAAFKIVRDGETKKRYFALAGFFGAFAVACDLPSLAFAAGLCAVLLVKNPKKTALVAIPLGLVVAGAFFATNYAAHQTFKPAYSCKRDHMKLAQTLQSDETTQKTADAQTAQNAETTQKSAAAQTAQSAETTQKSAAAQTAQSAEIPFDPNDWYYYRYYPSGRERVAKNARLSHWANRTGIDRGEPSIGRYAFHSTIGSRGVFSLTPVWVFSWVGLLVWAFRRRGADGENAKGLRTFALGAILLTLVFFAFFLTRDQGDRNYGGVSCCPRWFFPLVPLLTPALLPVVDKLSTSRWGRFVGYAALFWSAASAFYPTWTPWTSPWLYQLATDWGLMKPY